MSFKKNQANDLFCFRLLTEIMKLLYIWLLLGILDFTLGQSKWIYSFFCCCYFCKCDLQRFIKWRYLLPVAKFLRDAISIAAYPPKDPPNEPAKETPSQTNNPMGEAEQVILTPLPQNYSSKKKEGNTCKVSLIVSKKLKSAMK